jgi:hypothetical protein
MKRLLGKSDLAYSCCLQQFPTVNSVHRTRSAVLGAWPFCAAALARDVMLQPSLCVAVMLLQPQLMIRPSISGSCSSTQHACLTLWLHASRCAALSTSGGLLVVDQKVSNHVCMCPSAAQASVASTPHASLHRGTTISSVTSDIPPTATSLAAAAAAAGAGSSAPAPAPKKMGNKGTHALRTLFNTCGSGAQHAGGSAGKWQGGAR